GVRLVAAAGGDDGRGQVRRGRVDLGVGVGQREDDRVVVHLGDVLAAQHVRRGDADEHVRPGDRAAQVPAVAVRVGVGGDPGQVGVEVVAALVHRAVDVADHHVFGAGVHQQLEDGGA